MGESSSSYDSHSLKKSKGNNCIIGFLFLLITTHPSLHPVISTCWKMSSDRFAGSVWPRAKVSSRSARNFMADF